MSETMDGKNNLEKDYSCSIENYIRGDAGSNYSICREERQYVVFLYNILRKYHAFKDRSNNDEVHKIITKACGIPEKADIECVFYEATFMRDFFERNRRIHWEGSSGKKLLQKKSSPSGSRILMKESSFNYSLLKYVYEDMYKGKEFPKSFKWNQPENNLGQNKIEVPDDMKQIKPVIREMMNAKPDLAVIYSITEEDADKNYLLFLECKFESNEKSYESCYRQCEIQGKIADFLCKNYLNEKDDKGKGNIEVSPLMINDKEGNRQYASPLIQFTREEKKESKEIFISDLICLNNQIFL